MVKWGALLLVATSACTPYRPHIGSADRLPHDERIFHALDQGDASRRAHAAFLLGQLGIAWEPVAVDVQLGAEQRLLDRLDQENDPGVRSEIVAALGRVGRGKAARTLALRVASPGHAPGEAWALAHLFRRLRDHDLDPTPLVPMLETGLIAPEAEMRAAITDALAETKRDAARPALVRRLIDADPLTRARAARGLIGLAIADDVPALTKALADADERVAAGTALALAQLAESGRAPQLVADVFSRSLHELERPAVVIALAEKGLLCQELAPVFAALGERSKGPTRCLAALAHDRIVGRIDALGACEVDRDRFIARALGETNPKRAEHAVDALLALPVKDRRVRALVATALGRYDQPNARERLRVLAADPEPTVWASAAESAVLLKANELGPILLQHVPSKVVADEVDALLSLLTAIAALRPHDAAARIRPLLDGTPAAIAMAAKKTLLVLGEKVDAHPAVLHGPFDDLGLPDGPVIARLTTARGIIRIDLRADLAPRTVKNFVGLTRRGFYDGLDFHRIVPGFVAQGGDPQGDGGGGAGALVPCEPNPLRYVEGTVGMALSGLDTGSSQFFIALAPAPHLEGRYTAFGQVIEGMSIARALEPGDRIVRATIE